MSDYKDAVNESVDAIIDTLLDNPEMLLSPKVLERIESPAIVADKPRDLPIWYVIPLGKRGDNIDVLMDDQTSMHNFVVTLEGYYWLEANSNDQSELRFIRDLMFDCSELFMGSGSVLGSGHVKKITANQKIYQISDKVIHRIEINLTITMYN